MCTAGLIYCRSTQVSWRALQPKKCTWSRPRPCSKSHFMSRTLARHQTSFTSHKTTSPIKMSSRQYSSHASELFPNHTNRHNIHPYNKCWASTFLENRKAILGNMVHMISFCWISILIQRNLYCSTVNFTTSLHKLYQNNLLQIEIANSGNCDRKTGC